MKLTSVRIADLKLASYNPDNRVNEAKIKKLTTSIKKVGLLSPIIIDSHRNVIDGHRRIAAHKKLKIAMIPAIINDKIENKQAYREVNANSVKMTGNDNLGIWLKDNDAVSPRTDAYYKNIEAIVGLEMLKILYKNGLSGTAFKLAKQIALDVSTETSGEIKKILKWLVDHKMMNRVRKSYDAGLDMKVVLKAVNANKPLKTTLAIQE